MVDIPRSKSGKTAMQVAMDVARETGKILRDRFYDTKEIFLKVRTHSRPFTVISPGSPGPAPTSETKPVLMSRRL